MLKIIRFTDLHLNFLSDSKLDVFFIELSNLDVDGVFLTGDIADGLTIKSILLKFVEYTKCPIYYVLGNHDIYWSTFSNIYFELKDLHPRLFLLDICDPINLGSSILIGSSGWFDAGWRKPLFPLVFIADWVAIDDFSDIYSYKKFLSKIDDFSKYFAESLGKKLKIALSKSNNIYMLTHFPPTKIKRDSFFGEFWWDPYDSSRRMYETIEKEMNNQHGKHLQILAGHIHRNYQQQLLPNTHLNVSEATLGNVNKGQIFYLKEV